MDELTPEAVRAVRFREKLRGYHPDDVDAFIAEVARGVESLRTRIEELEARAQGAASIAPQEASGGATDTAQPASPGAADDLDETLRRTLVLAQRTADLAVQEAKAEASRLVEEASQHRHAVLSELEELREARIREIEDELRARREELEAAEQALSSRVADLQGALRLEQDRLRSYFTAQLQWLDEGALGPARPVGEDAPAGGADDHGGQDHRTHHSGNGDVDHDDAGTEGAQHGEHDEEEELDDEAYLAALREAMNDERPLGPRPHHRAP